MEHTHMERCRGKRNDVATPEGKKKRRDEPAKRQEKRNVATLRGEIKAQSWSNVRGPRKEKRSVAFEWKEKRRVAFEWKRKRSVAFERKGSAQLHLSGKGSAVLHLSGKGSAELQVSKRQKERSATLQFFEWKRKRKVAGMDLAQKKVQCCTHGGGKGKRTLANM